MTPFRPTLEVICPENSFPTIKLIKVLLFPKTDALFQSQSTRVAHSTPLINVNLSLLQTDVKAEVSAQHRTTHTSSGMLSSAQNAVLIRRWTFASYQDTLVHRIPEVAILDFVRGKSGNAFRAMHDPQPNRSLGRLTVEVARSHTIRHASGGTSSERVIT